MAIPKRKNIDTAGIFKYDEVSDSFIAWEGDVNLQVGGADVSSSNPVPISDVSTVYSPKIDEATAGTTYFGFCAVGSSASTGSAIWRIFKMVEASSVTTVTWADGNTNFDNVWDNRASLSYS